MLIFKIFRADENAELSRAGVTQGAPIDLADGFVHFSTAGQAAETLQRHFAGEDDLVLLALDADALGDDLRWEASRGGDLFPHLYRELRADDVLWTREIILTDDGHVLPELT